MSFTVDTTDDKGQAKAIVRLGSVAGRAVVRLLVPEFGVVDSATFTVTPGAPARVLALATDTALDIGATAKLSGRVVDRYGNLRPEVPTISAGAGNAVPVDGATGIATGRDMGTQWVFARYAALADSTSVRVVPSGRLVVWSPGGQFVRLVNLNGKEASNAIVSRVHSDLGGREEPRGVPALSQQFAGRRGLSGKWETGTSSRTIARSRADVTPGEAGELILIGGSTSESPTP